MSIYNRNERHVEVHHVSEDHQLSNQVERFWKFESIEPMVAKCREMSVVDNRVLKLWVESTVFIDGHYQMKIPFESYPPNLPNNRMIAEHRLKLLQRRLTKDPEMKEKYKAGIDDLIRMKYAQKVPVEELSRSDGKVWFIPHHPVLNVHKPGKVRIVFDCAATYRGTSLNEQIYSGPDFLASKLIGVLLRFRQGCIAFTADIESMFHQVRVNPADYDVLRFLWYEDNESNEPTEFRMEVHPFGGVWTPSCTTYALQLTAADNAVNFPSETVEMVTRNTYVDDCLKSVDSVDSGIQRATELRELLQKGGWRIHKYLSNSRELLHAIPDSERSKTVLDLDLDSERLPSDRALGVIWHVEEDKLGIQIGDRTDKPLTRRGMLNSVSSVYDPLGLLTPFVVPAKALLQEVCKLGLSWDEPLPEHICTQWARWLSDLSKLSELRIGRCVAPGILFEEISVCQLHHFADASKVAYGAVSYLRIVDKAGTIHCNLIMAKSHLASIKCLTIPRLELCAATVAVSLDKLVRTELDFAIQESVFWSDSTVVLSYIRSEEKRFLTFVANRVAQIHSGSEPSQWHHIDSKSNPADDLSRGLSADELLTDDRWFTGPAFLKGQVSESDY
jgi:hypothetical protein